jgi:hypothetical protein
MLIDGGVGPGGALADATPGEDAPSSSSDAPACSVRATDQGVWCCSVTCETSASQGSYCCPESSCPGGQCVSTQALGCDDQHDCVVAGHAQNICCGRAQAGSPVAYCLTDPQCQELSGEPLCFPGDPDPCPAGLGGTQCLPARSPLFVGYFSCQ